jgi:hypothetical protein
MRKLIMISNTIVMTGWPWKCFDALCFDLLPNTVARTAQHDAIALSEACPVMHTSGRAQNSDAYVVQLLDRPWGEAEQTSKAYAQPQSRPPPAAASGRDYQFAASPGSGRPQLSLTERLLPQIIAGASRPISDTHCRDSVDAKQSLARLSRCRP